MSEVELGDIMVDGHGKLWRVVGYMVEPSVTIEEIEPRSGVNILGAPDPKRRINLGVNGLTWTGMKRIHRPDQPLGGTHPIPQT